MPKNNFSILIEVIMCHSRISKYLEQSLAAVHGLSLSEYLALHYLQGSEVAMSRILLAGKMGLTASGITRLLNPMEKLGLITREVNERDARLSLVKLTVAGVQKLSDAKKSVEQASADCVAELNVKEKKSLSSMIAKLA